MIVKRGSAGVYVILSVVTLVSVVIGACLYGKYFTGQPPTAFSSRGPTVKQIEAMGHLTVLRISVADILEGKGYGYRGAWLIHGDALYTIDMRHAKLVTKDAETRTATIELPMPIVSRPRVDHNKTTIYSIEKTGWVPWTGDQTKFRNGAMKEAQRLMERAATQTEYVDVAKRNGELILKNLYSLVDWEIKIVWKPSHAQTGT